MRITSSEPIRRIWYRLDRRHFEAKSEHALSHGRLARRYASLFCAEHVEYRGGPLIHLFLHSMIIRLPPSVRLAFGPCCNGHGTRWADGGARGGPRDLPRRPRNPWRDGARCIAVHRTVADSDWI